jgi:TP901 family phage tail tape measure protein
MAFSISYLYQLVDKYSAPLRQISEKQRKFTSQVNTSKRALSGFSTSMTALSGALASTGAVMLGSRVFGTYLKFTTALNNLSAAALTTATDEILLKEKARELGATTAFTASQVLDASTEMQKTGFSLKDTLVSVSDVLNLAAATNLDLATSSVIVTDILETQRLEAKELPRVLNSLAQTSVKTSTNVLQLYQAFRKVSAFAREFGLDVEQVTAFLGAMAKGGLKSESAGTLWRAALKKLLKLTPAAEKALRKYNIEIDKHILRKGTETKFKNYGKLMRLIFDKVPVEEFFTIFGDEGAQAMIAAKVGTIDFYETLIALNRRAVKEDLITEMARRQMKGLPGIIKTLQSTWESLQITMFETGFDELVITSLNFLTKFLRFLEKVHPDLVFFVMVFSSILVLIGLIVGVALLLAPIFAALAGPVGAVALLITGIVAGLATIYRRWKKQKARAGLERLQEMVRPIPGKEISAIAFRKEDYEPVFPGRLSPAHIELGGEIKVSTDDKLKVEHKSSILEANVPGKLGLNIAP